MNRMNRLYQMCKIRFGTLDVKELEQLCAIYIVYQDPCESSRWITLYGRKKLTKRDCACLLETYLKHHTADEGLFKTDWLLKNEHIRQAYLHGLCTRPIPLSAAEETWILNCGEPGAMRCLKYPLSANNEYKLIQSDNFKMIDNYIICHLLRENGEAQLALNASDKEYPNRAAEYRRLLERYFECQHRMRGNNLFTGFMAQYCLFADERNHDFIMNVIEQCNMDNHVLENAIIRRMAWEMSPEYLTWYLAYSYVADKDLAAELLEKGLTEHQRDMLTISEQRRSIHEIISDSILFLSDDWRNDEREAHFRFSREDNAKKRMADLQEFLRPRFAKGVISPAMSAWVAARCPELAKEVLLNLTRFEQNIINKITFVNPFDLYHTGAILY